MCGLASNASPTERVTVTLHSTQSSLTIGDSLTVICSVTIPEGVRSSEPYLTEKSLFIDIENSWKKEESPAPGITRKQYGFLAYVFNADTLTVGPFAVEYETAEGNTGKALSNKLTIYVQGVVEGYVNGISEGPGPSPMPNRSPIMIAFHGIPVWLIVILITVILLFTGVLVHYIRKRKRSFPPQPPKPIDEIREFERIRALQLYEKGQVKELYIQVSDAMRGFIHRNMNYDAMYRTSEEIINGLSRISVEKSVLNSIHEVFKESDMVKFAKFLPHDDLSSTIIDRALKPVKSVLEKIKHEQERFAIEEKTKFHGKNEGKAVVENTLIQSGGTH